MKTYGGVDVYMHVFLDLGTSWRRVVSFTPRPLYPRVKSSRYPLDRRLGGPQNRSRRCGEEKPPIHWVPRAISLGIKRPGREAGHSPPTSAEGKKYVDPYIHSPIRHRDEKHFKPLF
jgi:hypothetical protein